MFKFFKQAPQGDNLVNMAVAAWQEPHPTPLPITQPCGKCGSIYLEQSLREEPTIVISLERGKLGAVTVNHAYSCEVCRGPADISLSLRTDGKEQDERHFDVTDHYFQEIDAATKEAVFTVAPEQYAELTCENCGELVERPQVKCCSYCKKGS